MKRKQIGITALLLAIIAAGAAFIAGPLSGTADEASRRDRQTAVFLAGDSTVSYYGESMAPRMGWGQVVAEHFNDEIVFLNHASPGRSSKSFIDEGRLEAIWTDMRSGDYLFIQFGHNDAKNEDSSRYTEPSTSYKRYLRKYIDGAKKRGATPVLVTSVERRRFDAEGNALATHEPYRIAMAELATQEQIPLIDLNTKSRALFQQLGPEGTLKLFMNLQPGESPNYPEGVNDNTHFSEMGARQMAMLVVDGIIESSLEPLKKHLKQ